MKNGNPSKSEPLTFVKRFTNIKIEMMRTSIMVLRYSFEVVAMVM